MPGISFRFQDLWTLLRHAGSFFSCGRQTLSCSMRDLVPRQGSVLGPQHWERGVFATGPAGSPCILFLEADSETWSLYIMVRYGNWRVKLDSPAECITSIQCNLLMKASTKVKPSCIPRCYFRVLPNPERFQELHSSTPPSSYDSVSSLSHSGMEIMSKTWLPPRQWQSTSENQGFPIRPRRREWRQPILHTVRGGNVFQSSRPLGVGRRACCFEKLCVIALGREQNWLQGTRRTAEADDAAG